MMAFLVKRGKHRLWSEVDAYRQKLASSDKVSVDEAIKCHTALLFLTRDREQRIRSVQTLASLGSPAAIPSAVTELVRLSREWPRKRVAHWPPVLLAVLHHACPQDDTPGRTGTPQGQVMQQDPIPSDYDLPHGSPSK
jgi:hypothetical protein